MLLSFPFFLSWHFASEDAKGFFSSFLDAGKIGRRLVAAVAATHSTDRRAEKEGEYERLSRLNPS